MTARLQSAVARKSEVELSLLLAEMPGLPPVARQAVLTLPRLSGGAGVLAAAEAVCLNATMMRALADLRSLAELLDGYGVSPFVTYDLAEVRDLGYYTGITFEGFAPGLGFGLISGGRYDTLIGHFGPASPAVGWALTLDRLLLARESQGMIEREPQPDVLLGGLAGAPLAAALSWAAAARERGLKVEVDPLGLDAEVLWQAAAARGIARAVYAAAGGSLKMRDAQATDWRVIPDGSWEEVASWRSL